MKIIITQAEIEEAIKAHVLSQINLADGQNISIDFKNTRGEDGATAEINITKPVVLSEKGASTQAAIVQHFRKPTPAAEVAAEPAEPVSEEPVTETPEVEENPQVSPAVQSATDGASNTTESISAENASGSSEPVEATTEEFPEIKRTVPFDADQPVDQEVVSEPANKTKSLFAGMNRRNATAE